jgi:hypothetical protein
VERQAGIEQLALMGQEQLGLENIVDMAAQRQLAGGPVVDEVTAKRMARPIQVAFGQQQIGGQQRPADEAQLP